MIRIWFVRHAAVSLFIQDLPSRCDFAQERVAFLQSPFHVLRRPHDQINGKRIVGANADARRLVETAYKIEPEKPKTIPALICRVIGA